MEGGAFNNIYWSFILIHSSIQQSHFELSIPMIQQQKYKIIYLPGYSLGYYLPWQRWKIIQCPSVGWMNSGGTSTQWKTKQRRRESLVCDMEWLPGYVDKWKGQGMKQNTCDLRNRSVEKYRECLIFGKQNNRKLSQKKKGFSMTEERKQRCKHGFCINIVFYRFG